jgi:hypothetical protein
MDHAVFVQLVHGTEFTIHFEDNITDAASEACMVIARCLSVSLRVLLEPTSFASVFGITSYRPDVDLGSSVARLAALTLGHPLSQHTIHWARIHLAINFAFENARRTLNNTRIKYASLKPFPVAACHAAITFCPSIWARLRASIRCGALLYLDGVRAMAHVRSAG